MKIVIACDSFKGSLTSAGAGEACRRGILSILPDAETDVVTIGDGGEGTVAAICAVTGARQVTITVHGPLGTPVEASYAITPDNSTAIMETAAAAGLTLVSWHDRNALKANTRGLGEMIADAYSRGCSRIIVGLGGSATTDAGTGMLAALGVRFLDRNGREVTPCGGNLAMITAADTSGVSAALTETKFDILCDVTNPLFGELGAARIFAPQKGASPDEVELLDEGLRNFAAVASHATGRDCAAMTGAGAAGGLGYAFAEFAEAVPRDGASVLLEIAGMDRRLEGASLVITGEGKADAQTLMGKAPLAVLRTAQARGIPVVLLGGSVADTGRLAEAGFAAVLPIAPGPCTLAEAMADAADNLHRTAAQVAALMFRERGAGR